VQPAHPHLSVRRQCQLLDLSRSGYYYEPEEVGPEALALMKRIDRLHMKWPFYGSRRMVVALNTEDTKGTNVGRKHVQTLMRLMGLEGQAPGPHTSQPHPEHKVYPYLLRNLKIDRPDQVWATDITYIPLETGWAYLVAIIDWYSRAVLSFRLSNTMETAFCTEALDEALRQYGPPEIFNSDQGAQFTAEEFTGVLKSHEIQISMDGRGRCLDNVFVERLWRSLKYEDVYLRGYATLPEARAGIAAWIRFYNRVRPHQGLGYATPMDVYQSRVHLQAA
jgi:putative transposase